MSSESEQHEPRFTQEAADEYNAKIACPLCDSTDFEIGEPEVMDARTVVISHECNHCGVEWVEAYRLYGIGNFVTDSVDAGVAVRTFSDQTS